MALARPRRASKRLACRLWILSSTYEKGKYCYDQQVQGIWGQYWYNFPFVFHICFPHLSLTLISHTCFPYLFPTGFLGPHEFLLISHLFPILVSHTCLPYLSPTLVSHSGFLGAHGARRAINTKKNSEIISFTANQKIVLIFYICLGSTLV